MQIVQSPIIRLVLSVFPNCMMPLWDWLMEAVCLCSQVCQPIKETRRTAGGAWIVWQAPVGLNQLWNQDEDSMNLFVAMAIISFLFFQTSCGALLNCESRNAWDREYKGGSVYQKCVNYRDREQSRWYDRVFGFWWCFAQLVGQPNLWPKVLVAIMKEQLWCIR